MHWDGSISLGTVVSLATILVVFYKAHATNRDRLMKLETMLEPIADWWNSHQERRNR